MTTARTALAELTDEMPNAIEGDNERWLDWATAYGMSLPIPNIFGRYTVLPYHDLHHVVTGYGTDQRGECEMAAWGLAAGAAPPIARFFDTVLTALGLLFCRKRTLAAWRAGRGCRPLYDIPFHQLLDMEIAELREWVQEERV